MPAPAASPWPRLLLGLLALGLLALVIHTIFSEHGYLELRRERKNLERLQSEIERLQEENRRLAVEIEALKNDPRAIERVAREELKMARPGEKIITLPPEKPSPSKSGTTEEKKP